MFDDRTDAGAQLADLLDDHDIEVDVVLAIPRGGLPVGRVVADRLGVPLDVVTARKIGAPDNPELALGAVAADGTVWLNESLVETLGIGETYLEDAIEREAAAARRKVERYGRDRAAISVGGKHVLVVDDGVATGATMTACCRQLAEGGAARIVVGVPVGPPDTIERLLSEADEVVCVETPPHFGAVGSFYGDFEQVTDDEAIGYLR